MSDASAANNSARDHIMLQSSNAEAGLEFVADERKGASEGSPGGFFVARREVLPDFNKEVGYVAVGHCADGAAFELFNEELAIQTAEDGKFGTGKRRDLSGGKGRFDFDELHVLDLICHAHEQCGEHGD